LAARPAAAHAMARQALVGQKMSIATRLKTIKIGMSASASGFSDFFEIFLL
jgi:uncharacterized membrane protein